MSAEQNKAAIRRQLEGLNTRNVSVLEKLADELYAANYTLHDPDYPGLPPGPEGVKQFVRGTLESMPDVHVTIEDMVAEGDRVATRFTVDGTNASTGKPMRILVMAISRFVGGKIAEEWELGVPAAPQP
jgi:predicted SnoaL-like aldol condensation-catalyzing enzyme